MNADSRRWIRLAAALLLTACGEIRCTAADITPPSDRQPAKGVAEYADEFADQEQSQKPLVEWTLPFTQNVVPTGMRMRDAMGRLRPNVRLDDQSNQNDMEPTPVELLIQRGFPLGEWNTSNQLVDAITLPFTR